jgi:hypothetical protein
MTFCLNYSLHEQNVWENEQSVQPAEHSTHIAGKSHSLIMTEIIATFM